MSISFDLVPSNLRVPGVFTEIDSSQATAGASLITYKHLIIGQITADATVPANVPVTGITSVQAARAAFGAGSQLAIMVEAAIASNNITEIVCMPLADNAAGVAAAGSVAFSGAPTAAGSVNLYIGGKLVQIAVATTDTPDSLATALAAAITAATTLPVTAAVDAVTTSQVNITAKNKGEAGNSIDLRLNYNDEATAAGLIATITAMAAGANNPVLDDAIAALGDQWYNVWSFPYTDAASLTAIETELSSRSGPMREVEAQGFTAATGSQATLGTLGNSRNSQFVTIVEAHAEPMPAFAKAAETASIVAYYSSIDPARPLQTLPYAYCLPPAEADRFTLEERNLLLFDGIATTYVDAGGVMRTERLITTYKTNAAGASDTAYLDSETLYTLMTIRHDWRDYIKTKYPRHKLADDGTRIGAGQAVVTPNVIKAEAFVKFREWEELGLVENFDQFKADLIVERNAADPNRLDVVLPPDLINGLRIMGVKLSFRL